MTDPVTAALAKLERALPDKPYRAIDGEPLSQPAVICGATLVFVECHTPETAQALTELFTALKMQTGKRLGVTPSTSPGDRRL